MTLWEVLNEWQQIVDDEISDWESLGDPDKKKPSPLSQRTKGWAASVVEGLFGEKANNSRKRDLDTLELKTFGVDEGWTPIERFLPLCAFNWQEVNDQSFSESKIRNKIMQQLWIPILKNENGLGPNATVEGIGDFILGPPMIWIPTEVQSNSMAEDYNRVRIKVMSGSHEDVRASNFTSINEYLVPNTAGANKLEKTSYHSQDGRIHNNVKRRKWNLKREIVGEIISLHRA